METKDAKLEQIVNKYKYAGLTILHANKDDIDLECIYGNADLEKNKQTSFDTIYRIASVSKVIVALAAMTLYEKEKLDIYEDISTYLGYEVRNPKYKDKKITCEMLMTQTSSINDGADSTLGYDGVNGPRFEVSLQDLLTNKDYKYYTDKTYLDSLPGEKWCYSNFGCGILACIIEKVSGKLFTDYVKEVILDPLEIDGGFRIDQVKNKEAVASLYDVKNDSFVLDRNLELFEKYLFPKYSIGDNFRGPAGGLFISASDLAKIGQMMMNKGCYKGKQILKESTINEMEKVHWQGSALSDPTYKAKGLQLKLMDGFSKETLKGHFGSAYGLRSFMFYNSNNLYIYICNGGIYREVPGDITSFQRDVLEYLIKKYENE